jgi:hypothetical protein
MVLGISFVLGVPYPSSFIEYQSPFSHTREKRKDVYGRTLTFNPKSKIQNKEVTIVPKKLLSSQKLGVRIETDLRPH